MPLRDHFRPPLDNLWSWDGLHGGLPMEIATQLNGVLPKRYIAMPKVHLGSVYEVDTATFDQDDNINNKPPSGFNPEDGNLAVVKYSPPKPTLKRDIMYSEPDIYEVNIYDEWRDRRIVAAVEVISPSNKNGKKKREAFVSKAEKLLRFGVCFTILDIVSTSNRNLYASVLNELEEREDSDEMPNDTMYASTMILRNDKLKHIMETWYFPLEIGQSLPQLPLWLNESLVVSLDLESCYEGTCRKLRIP